MQPEWKSHQIGAVRSHPVACTQTRTVEINHTHSRLVNELEPPDEQSHLCAAAGSSSWFLELLLDSSGQQLSVLPVLDRLVIQPANLANETWSTVANKQWQIHTKVLKKSYTAAVWTEAKLSGSCDWLGFIIIVVSFASFLRTVVHMCTVTISVRLNWTMEDSHVREKNTHSDRVCAQRIDLVRTAKIACSTSDDPSRTQVKWVVFY